MKKPIKIFISLIGICVVLLGIYAYKLHSLAIEGNRIFELRCTDVNPPLITYKNAFLSWADYLKSPEKYTEEEFTGFFSNYISFMREYVSKESEWLAIQEKYGDRLDFKLVSPWYLKQAWLLQFNMYEAYRNDAQAMLAMWDKGNPDDELISKQTEARNRRNEAEQKYFDFFDEARAISDWRKIFSYLPEPKGCNEENMTIPETGGSINWEGTPTPQPKVSPGLEDISG